MLRHAGALGGAILVVCGLAAAGTLLFSRDELPVRHDVLIAAENLDVAGDWVPGSPCPDVRKTGVVTSRHKGVDVRGYYLETNPSSFGAECPRGYSQVFDNVGECSYECWKFVPLKE